MGRTIPGGRSGYLAAAVMSLAALVLSGGCTENSGNPPRESISVPRGGAAGEGGPAASAPVKGKGGKAPVEVKGAGGRKMDL